MGDEAISSSQIYMKARLLRARFDLAQGTVSSILPRTECASFDTESSLDPEVFPRH